MMRWVEIPRPQVSQEFIEAVGGNRMLAEILASRGVTDLDQARAFLDPRYYHPSPPEQMPGMTEAIALIEHAIKEQIKIGVWGDFDVDGQTATTVLASGLRMLGADVVYHIPVRATESHGVNIRNLAKMLDGGVGLIVTCDTGIGAHDAVRYSRNRNVKFIITDHHDLPPELPQANAILNSKLLPDHHPLSTLPGVGVAYKLVEGLFTRQNRSDEVRGFLDLVALGIVADIAILHGDARYLLQQGLAVLRNTQRLGLQILCENAEILRSSLNEEDISYSLAPRLNSLGRLGDANVIVEFLTSEQESMVRVLAARLEGLNAQRKLLSSQVFQAAVAQIERDPSLLKNAALVLSSPNWPAGVVGIVANRLVERYRKPAVLLTGDDEGLARGSARSINGCDISKAIAACSDLLESYGGHPMAAGLALPASRIETFRKRLSEAVLLQLGEVDFEPELAFDLMLDIGEVSLPLLEQIEQLAPFGSGNPPLIFVASNLRMISHSLLGRTEEHLRLLVENLLGEQQQVVWWQGAGWDLPSGVFDLAFAARKNVFRGDVKLQLELIDFKVVEITEAEEPALEVDVHDLRKNLSPQQHLENLMVEHPEATIWAEGLVNGQIESLARHEVGSTDELVLWNCPPSGTILRSVLEVANPNRVYVYGVMTEWDDLEPFINRLAGLCKFAVSRKNGRANLQELTSAMAHTKAAVRLGLEWLENAKKIVIEEEDRDSLVIGLMEKPKEMPISLDITMDQLAPLLRETKAFRNYFRTCSEAQLENLIRGK